MRTLPLGYSIKDGAIVVDEEQAQRVRELFSAYLSGMSLAKAAQSAGIQASSSTVKHILKNKHYLGDDYYPALIAPSIFQAAHTARLKRAKKLGKNFSAQPDPVFHVATAFFIETPKRHYADPFREAQALYACIKEVEGE